MSLTKLAAHDCVIMLTFSDWFSEMFSNRYHYASRFSVNQKVFFVQVNGLTDEFEILPTQFSNVEVVKINSVDNLKEMSKVFAYIWNQGFSAPLFWVYNPYFSLILKTLSNPQIVYHATEDYFCDDFIHDKDLHEHVRATITMSKLVVSVSDGVAENIRKNVPSTQEMIVASNGCDYEVWSSFSTIKKEKKVVYQGGIHRKIDFKMVLKAVEAHPDIEFVFLGDVTEKHELWSTILKKSNVVFKGKLGLTELVREVSQCQVGIIPFVQNDWIVNRSFPLKFYEYLSAGLEVVSVPITSLPSVLYTQAPTEQAFSDAIKIALEKVRTESDSESRIEACKKADYSAKFNLVMDKVNSITYKSSAILQGLIIVDTDALENQAVQQHVDGLLNTEGIQFKIMDLRIFSELNSSNLLLTDIVVFHYSVRFFASYFPRKSIELAAGFSGMKIVFIQDEYDEILTVRNILAEMKISLFFTCVPDQYREKVYPRVLFPGTHFINCLTGYVTPELIALGKESEQSETVRDIDVFYRGRTLPLMYGSLGYDKYIIGKKFKEIVEPKNLCLDIEVDDSHRIYGDQWYQRLSRSKTMLGTESGSNLFDFKGGLKEKIQEISGTNSTLESKIASLVSEYEGEVRMNQISPKIFEMFATGCVPILFEGTYSGIIQPGVHFIELKKDFSNIDQVLAVIHDEGSLSGIRNNNFNFLKTEQTLTYKSFVDESFLASVYRGIALINKPAYQELQFAFLRRNIGIAEKVKWYFFMKRFGVLGLKRTLHTSGQLLGFDSERVYQKIKKSLQSSIRNS